MTVSTAPSHAESLARTRGRRAALRAARSVAFGAAIAVVLSVFFRNPFWPTLVQSVCIAFGCWFAIDLLRIPLARWAHRNDPPDLPESASRWPGWPLMLVGIVVGSGFGFTVGNELANAILGRASGPGYFRGDARQITALVLGALIPGAAITWFFYTRETIAAKEAAVQVARRQAAEHQLKLLESQLEPHMLFNTLANLRVLIGLDPARAQAMLDQLIAFLRAMLAGSRTASHPLSAEFARLSDYLALMRIRMGARLDAAFELPAALAEVSIPPLLLQPLVENAIRHGLEPSVDGGRIVVSAARDAGTLVLTVRDTGVGLGAGSVGGTRFGLQQVRDRLSTLYGDRATLVLRSAEAADNDAQGVEGAVGLDAGDGGRRGRALTDRPGGTLAIVRLPLDDEPGPTA